LLEDAGKNLRFYSKWTYVGYGLQATKLALAIFGPNEKVQDYRAATLLISWFIFDALGAHFEKKAGKSLQELGKLW